ncbi:MAG: hypothetical protein ACFB2Z_12550 [Maricaulaceae bacterium]
MGQEDTFIKIPVEAARQLDASKRGNNIARASMIISLFAFLASAGTTLFAWMEVNELQQVTDIATQELDELRNQNEIEQDEVDQIRIQNKLIELQLEELNKYVAIEVLPLVEMTTVAGAQSSETGSQFDIMMTNNGRGVGHLRSLRLQVYGEVQSSWADVALTLGHPGASFVTTDVVDRALLVGEPVPMISVRSEGLARALARAMTADDTNIAYCYCSFFDDCWVVDSARGSMEPEEIESPNQCPAYGEDNFQG